MFSLKRKSFYISDTVIQLIDRLRSAVMEKKLQVMLLTERTDILAVASSYPEPADAKLTPLLSCLSLNLGSWKPGMLLAIPSFSAAQPQQSFRRKNISLNNGEHHLVVKKRYDLLEKSVEVLQREIN